MEFAKGKSKPDVVVMVALGLFAGPLQVAAELCRL